MYVKSSTNFMNFYNAFFLGIKTTSFNISKRRRNLYDLRHYMQQLTPQIAKLKIRQLL